MKTQTTTPTAQPVHLGHLTIYPNSHCVYSHDVQQLFSAQELTTMELDWIERDLRLKFGKDKASQVMEQLTANK